MLSFRVSTGILFLGRSEVYVQADLEMKRKALESATGPQPTQPAKALPSGLIEWIESL